MMGDGEMAEGQVWEAAEFAGHYKLDNLTVLADVNALGQSEPTMYQHDMEIYRKKFEAEGWAAEVIDGHDVAAVLAALDRAKATKGRPQAIIARTIKGHGFSQVAGKLNWHGKPFSKARRDYIILADSEDGVWNQFGPVKAHNETAAIEKFVKDSGLTSGNFVAIPVARFEIRELREEVRYIAVAVGSKAS